MVGLFHNSAPWPLGPWAPSLAAVSFTTPAMLFGAALIVWPIVAHLLNRRARQRIVFPSVALLAAASSSQSSMFKLRRWWLLLLRCAAVILAVLAFARPVWLTPAPTPAPGSSGTNPAGGDGSGGGGVVMLVLDVSASTQQRLGDGRGALDHLRDRALAELAGLRVGRDRANLILVDAAPAAVFAAPTQNLDALRAALRDVKPTQQRADFAAALTLAGQQLADHADADPRHVVLLTDGQASNWENATDAAALPPGTTLTIRSLDGAALANLALRDPAARPAVPNVNVPVELSVELAAFGNPDAFAAADRRRVDLLIDGREIESRWVRVEPGRPPRIGFTHRFDTAGPHRVAFRLAGDDALALDQTVGLVVSPVQRRPVLILGDDPPDQPGTTGYYLTRALAPFNNDRDRFGVTHLTPAALNDRALRGAALVCVGDVFRPDPQVTEILQRYVDDGGALLVFAGEFPLRGDRLLPWSLNSPAGPAKLTDGDWNARPLAGFDLEARDALARTAIRRPWSVAALADDARVLLSYDNQQPALASRPLGRGRVIAATFSPAAWSGQFGKYSAFVVLTQSLAESLTADRSLPPPTLAGQTLRLTAADAPDPQGPASIIQTPADTPARHVVFALDGDMPVATVPAAGDAGFYRWQQGPATLGLAAVQLDPRESDLRPLPGPALAERIASRSNTAVNATTLNDPGNTLDLRGRSLWGWALLAALGLLCVEMGLLGGWRR